MDNRFQYTPLDLSPRSDEALSFRILEVHSASSSIDGIISCTLLESCLHVLPDIGERKTFDAFEPQHSYETTSYAWGDASIRANVRVDDRLLEVTRSAEQVLRRIQLQDESRLIWIDAICIDQTNLEERAHQVALMAKLYRHGQRNLVYLGEAYDSTASALSTMESFRATERFDFGWGASDCTIELILLGEPALAQFFCRPWFK